MNDSRCHAPRPTVVGHVNPLHRARFLALAGRIKSIISGVITLELDDATIIKIRMRSECRQDSVLSGSKSANCESTSLVREGNFMLLRAVWLQADAMGRCNLGH